MRSAVKVLGVALWALVGVTPVAAQEEGLSAIKRLEMSRALYLDGMAQGDVVLIVAAAKLRGAVRMQAADRAPEGSDGVAPQQSGFLTALDMLRDAQQFARGRPLDTSIIDAAWRAFGGVVIEPKGLQAGPAFSAAAIAAKKVDKYPGLTFVGNSFAEVYIEGNGRQNLDLFVYDSKGRLVCSDTDAGDFGHCGWYPEATQTYRVEVVNKGGGSTQYSLVTN